jgi:hypothetical protein
MPRTVAVPRAINNGIESKDVRFESPPSRREGLAGIFRSPERELGPSGSDEISKTVFMRRKALYL